MKKKTAKNRYGVQVGDIFNMRSYHEDGGGYFFIRSSPCVGKHRWR